ncbi:hypothetical protein HOLleu_19514 [Holothuria leucospilota]|uniref:Uncharacterized protein n=1 Tax=Holothuria leucospilota TaxID=206669 RepID=A0A9Q1H7P4_HOLLE|nr:hypothetical protein HOLleu_19514 [Holothuria leucospilota]
MHESAYFIECWHHPWRQRSVVIMEVCSCQAQPIHIVKVSWMEDQMVKYANFLSIPEVSGHGLCQGPNLH